MLRRHQEECSKGHVAMREAAKAEQNGRTGHPQNQPPDSGTRRNNPPTPSALPKSATTSCGGGPFQPNCCVDNLKVPTPASRQAGEATRPCNDARNHRGSWHTAAALHRPSHVPESSSLHRPQVAHSEWMEPTTNWLKSSRLRQTATALGLGADHFGPDPADIAPEMVEVGTS